MRRSLEPDIIEAERQLNAVLKRRTSLPIGLMVNIRKLSPSPGNG